MKRWADIEGPYRYRLGRDWQPPAMDFFRTPADASSAAVVWVMLNPSTADAEVDDQTVRKCVGFTRALGAESLRIVNLFAWRATDPKELAAARAAGQDIVGPRNNEQFKLLLEMQKRGTLKHVICGWGAYSGLGMNERIAEVLQILKPLQLWCLGRTKGSTKATGQPCHPLMLAYATKLERYPH